MHGLAGIRRWSLLQSLTSPLQYNTPKYNPHANENKREKNQKTLICLCINKKISLVGDTLTIPHGGFRGLRSNLA